MDDPKIKITFRMDEETNQMIKAVYKEDNCNSQNEFIEKAVKFYVSYVTSSIHASYLNPAILNAVKSALRESEARTANNLFRLAVEMSVTMNVLADGMDVPPERIRELRGRCVDAVKSQKGKYTFEDALIDANQ